ncbi:MAG: RNA polymerase factor sigma-54 [Treponema sp.]|nr:RNA polymerase factor sigma-54 [Treponema sp.]MCL2271535.1 RNA polymerase factor sigma-54 [Treponema sp.]
MQLQRQSLVQGQRLKMNPQLYQSIKLLELPVFELRERIEQELEINPALEVIEDNSTVSLDEAETEKSEEEEYFEATSDPGRYASEQASEEHRRFIEGVLTRADTLQEHLLWQLQLEPVDDELKSTAEILIQNLDDDGFHKEKPETLFTDTNISRLGRLEEAMNLIRGFDPAGTCTDDYRESLNVQIRMRKDAPHGIEKILDNLELLEREKYAALAKKTGLNEAQILAIGEYIKKLSPFPGRSFAGDDVRYVIPDIKVVRDKDEFTVILNDEAFPVLAVNDFFMEMTNSSEQSARDFAKENIREARLFINHLGRRNRTLIRVADAIVKLQGAFFCSGSKSLAPLTLKDIAEELNIHETTVSRIANGKYMQTEWGIFEIRYFFTNSIGKAGANNSNVSKESVKEIIKEIISMENRLLSDQDICALLGQKGIALARRTVAKYRKELDMGSSYKRKVNI